jgi:hypothetical protein
MSVYSGVSRSMCEYKPISVPIRIVLSVGFWFSFRKDVMVCSGFLSMNMTAVNGSASSSVLPMNECVVGPCRVPVWLKNMMMKGCMSGAMLPSNIAGRYA